MKKVQIPGKSRHSPGILLTSALIIFGFVLILTAGIRVVRFALSRFSEGFFYPYLTVLTPSDRLSDTSLLLLDKSELAARVEKLTDVNRELALQSQAAESLMEENRSLRNMLHLRFRSKQRYVIAEILLRDPLNSSGGFTIARGSRDAVLPGAAVVSVDASGQTVLVGVVAETGARTSKVITILNPALRISGRVDSNREVGFIHTQEHPAAKGRISFGMLPVRNDYIHGNIVSTTGLEHGIPGGIKIGELHTLNLLRSYEQEDFNCELLPAADFSGLRFVAVAVITPAPEEK